MAWRIVQQPNGLFARFSEVVDNFTHYNMTREEAVNECRNYQGMGQSESEKKVQCGIDAGVYGWDEAISTIRAIHGDEEANLIVNLHSMPQP